jgi:hypothetical protein
MVDPELSQEFKVGVKLNKQPKVDKKPSKVGEKPIKENKGDGEQANN